MNTHVITAKKGHVEVVRTDSNIKLSLSRDEGRIYSRPGAGWVDMTPEAAEAVATALLKAVAEVKSSVPLPKPA